MSKPISLYMLVATMVISAQATAASLKDAKTAFKSGNWKVLRSTDAMTDNTTCTGIYKDNYSIQLVKDSLYVTVRGGIQSVTLRFGENPPREVRLAEEMEKDIGTVIISGSDFSDLLKNNRLRVQVLTLVRGVEDVDLDTTGIQAAVENIQSGCPLQPEPPKVQTVAAPISVAALEPICSGVLIARMKAARVKDAQIKIICKE